MININDEEFTSLRLRAPHLSAHQLSKRIDDACRSIALMSPYQQQLTEELSRLTAHNCFHEALCHQYGLVGSALMRAEIRRGIWMKVLQDKRSTNIVTVHYEAGGNPKCPTRVGCGPPVGGVSTSESSEEEEDLGDRLGPVIDRVIVDRVHEDGRVESRLESVSSASRDAPALRPAPPPPVQPQPQQGLNGKKRSRGRGRRSN